MIKAKKGKLKVESDETRLHISVPVDRANDLHDYLRANRVHSAPPQPYFKGFDSIELSNDTDVASVQGLLNAWG